MFDSCVYVDVCRELLFIWKYGKDLHAVTVIYINKDFENRVCAFSFANIIYRIIILVAFYSL